MVCVLYQILEAGWRLSVSYMRQHGGYLSATWSRMAVVCRVCVLCQIF